MRQDKPKSDFFIKNNIQKYKIKQFLPEKTDSASSKLKGDTLLSPKMSADLLSQRGEDSGSRKLLTSQMKHRRSESQAHIFKSNKLTPY